MKKSMTAPVRAETHGMLNSSASENKKPIQPFRFRKTARLTELRFAEDIVLDRLIRFHECSESDAFADLADHSKYRRSLCRSALRNVHRLRPAETRLTLESGEWVLWVC